MRSEIVKLMVVTVLIHFTWMERGSSNQCHSQQMP